MTQGRILKKLDAFLSPPPNYANFTYADRLKKFVCDIKARKNPARNAVHLCKLSVIIGLSYLLYPVCLILKKQGYRFCNIDLSQIGSVIYLDLFLREDKLERQTPRHKILALASVYTDGNRYLLDMYDGHVKFIRNPFIKALLSPFFVSGVFDDNSFSYDLTFHTDVRAHDIWNTYLEKYKKPLIAFPQTDVKKAQDLLKRYIPEGIPFVALHVRDNGFYNVQSQTTRNADIKTYKAAIQYLIAKGYAVVRLGDPKMVEVAELQEECGALFFDYAHSDIRSEMMDCYLLSHCAFFIGLASGPASVPMLFGVNSCDVNWYNVANAPNFMAGDITTFKKFRYKKDGTFVPLEVLFREPLNRNPPVAVLEELGIVFEDNTAQEIYDTVKEYVEIPRGHVSALQEKAQKMILKTNYAYGAKGCFSDTILRKVLKSEKEAAS